MFASDNRSACRTAVVLGFFLFITGISGGSFASGQDAISNRKPTLEERLTYGLKVRTADEKKFIKELVALVDSGKLKQKTVDESFFWVQREMERKKKGHPRARKYIEKYPFFYFRQIVKLNAKRNDNLIIK